MSHEIRTPLSAIIGPSEVLEPRLREEQSRLWIFFAVADTGISIPGAARPHLFESFQRLHGSLTRVHHEGTGLGPAITKQLVERIVPIFRSLYGKYGFT
jgi:signal transduction histidine kinase